MQVEYTFHHVYQEGSVMFSTYYAATHQNRTSIIFIRPDGWMDG